MPKRTDIKSICVLGSGPVVIGQAAEFDYSGTQAIKALKEDGYRVILINSNPATIMTNKELADVTYVEPLTLSFVTEILKKERPCALLSTVGGQTAINLSMALYDHGILDDLSIELIGADIEAIKRAEDREEFKKVMHQASLPTLRSKICRSLDEAHDIAKEFGLPVVIRPSFTLGGTGGGIAYNKNDLETHVQNGLSSSPTNEVLIEESVIGHKEFEFEVIRDGKDNAVIVCSIENFDPMGVHTGDSITVAPAQTLSDVEYQRLRDASLQVVRAIGVKTGGSNVQFSVDPKSNRFAVIEMNPRVSRSSALASKATGYPIAKVAAKLAVGYYLDEIINDITKKTTAAFEPSLDYVVVKMPKFAFEKFSDTKPVLTTQMRSVGEVMAIGRSFKESLQKAMAALNDEPFLFSQEEFNVKNDAVLMKNYLEIPSPKRLPKILASLFQGMSVQDIADSTKIDRWFLYNLKEIIDLVKRLATSSLTDLNYDFFLTLKMHGFMDKQIAQIMGEKEESIKKLRLKHDIKPLFKRVDTCAGEFLAHTPYLYSTYEKPSFVIKNNDLVKNHNCEAKVTRNKKIAVIGSGAIRIGQGIEFDCCSTECVLALKDMGYETIMINCNPETVSTDFDIPDRLYFEPLTLEHVSNILDLENPEGVIVQLGGQSPLSLAGALQKRGVNILGTSPDSIDCAEDRKRSSALFSSIGLRQPPSCSVLGIDEAIKGARDIGFPLMVRPSYVLGGRAMMLAYSEKEIRQYVTKALELAPDKPVLIDRFLDGAIELDVDAICDGKDIYVASILQHIEEAGIHSGDSACVLPPYDLTASVIDEVFNAMTKICMGLKVIGLINVQFAVKNSALYVLEANPRASRTIPFASKATGIPLVKIATQVMCGKPLPNTLKEKKFMEFIPKERTSIKAPVMPFNKFPHSDPLLGPEMRSTGEVMTSSNTFASAFLKSQIASSKYIEDKGTLFVSIANCDKEAILPAIKLMHENGFNLVATDGTHKFLKSHQIDSKRVNKVRQGSPHVLDLINNKTITIMFNTILGSVSVYDSHLFRKKALEKNIPYYTSVAAAKALAKALAQKDVNALMSVNNLQEQQLFNHAY